MSYLTDAEIETILSDDRLAEFTAESGTAADSSVVAGLRSDVDDRIDSALAGSYAVPITSETDLRTIRPHAKVLFKWACLMRRSLSPDEATRIAYEATERFLDRLQKGDAKLSPSASPAPVPSTATGSGSASASIGSAEAVASGVAGLM